MKSLLTICSAIILTTATVVPTTLATTNMHVIQQKKTKQQATKYEHFQKNPIFTNKTISAIAYFGGQTWIGTAQHGLYQSSDGTHFIQNKSFATTTKITKLFSFDNTLYVGTAKSGLYVCLNKGKTFSKNTLIPNKAISYIGQSLGVVYVAFSQQGVYKTFDHGRTFVKEASNLFYGGATGVTTFKNATYISSINNGVWVSKDGGKTFTSLKGFDLHFGVTINVFQNEIQLGTFTGLYTSVDGVTWTKNLSLPQEDNATVDEIATYNNISYVDVSGYGMYQAFDRVHYYKIASIPAGDIWTTFYYNSTIYFGSQAGSLYESFDNGKTFATNPSIKPQGDASPVVIEAGLNTIYVGLNSNGGLYQAHLK